MYSRLLLATSLTLALSISEVAAADEDDKSDVDKASLWNDFHLGGYTSAGINRHPAGKTDGAINEVSIIFSWENDSRFKFFSEVELEKPISFNKDNSSVGKDMYVDLERLYLDYNLSEKLNLRAGRFLTPTGRWNLIHAAPLVWTSSRPLATSRLFPASTNGLMFYGATPFANKALEYSFFIEALKDQHIDHQEIAYKDTKGARFSLTGSVNWGLSLLDFHEEIPGNPHFQLLGLDFLSKQGNWEFSGEAFQRFYSDHSNAGSGAYLQGVAPLGNQWFAVARLESFKRPTEGSSERWLLGTAWRLTSNRILKIEYAGGDEERTESPKGLLASFAILF